MRWLKRHLKWLWLAHDVADKTTSGARGTEGDVCGIYAPIINGEPLRQTEIISGLVQVRQSYSSLSSATAPEIERKSHPYALVLTQDCDLENDFKTRNEKSEGGVSAEGLLPNILLCEVITLAALRKTAPGSDVWRKVKANKDERYHVLQSVVASADALNKGLPPLGIDFKRYFTIPTEELYFQIGSGARRRCRLNSPYLEHLSTRFSAFLARVAVPAPHDIDLK